MVTRCDLHLNSAIILLQLVALVCWGSGLKRDFLFAMVVLLKWYPSHIAVTQDPDRFFPRPKTKQFVKISDIGAQISQGVSELPVHGRQADRIRVFSNCRVHLTMQVTDSSAEN